MSRTLTIAEERKLSTYVQATNRLHEAEEGMRACRRDFIKGGGPLEIARKMLHTPRDLKELAGFLWYGQPILITEEAMTLDRSAATTLGKRPLKRFIRFQVQPSTNGTFSENFLLKYSDDDGFAKSREDALMGSWDTVKPMMAAKIRSDVLDRYNARAARHALLRQQRAPSVRQKMIRELAIETARWLYPLEEWATIFPDAALAKDYDFIKRILDKWSEPPTQNLRCWVIARFWNGFESVGLGDGVPPLKHWTNKAACELVAFWCGEPVSIDAYKSLKKKMRRRSEKPKLVTQANYTRQGKNHLLRCKRWSNTTSSGCTAG